MGVGFNSRLDEAEERISDLKNRAVELTQTVEKRKTTKSEAS